MAVRPAFIKVHAEGRKTIDATGPRRRGGYLTCNLTLRTEAGGISAPILISAGGEDGEAFVHIPDSLRGKVHILYRPDE